MFEHRREQLLPFAAFIVRVLKSVGMSVGLIAFSIGVGAFGYHVFENMRWLDSVYAAAMILTGMGPVGELKTDAAKVFVTLYALFSGLVFLTAGGIIVTPLFHRLMHKFHLEETDTDQRA